MNTEETKFPDASLLKHPTIPKPLHGVTPRKILGKTWWDKQRKAAYAMHDDRCWACGVHKKSAMYRKWLEGHEFYEIEYETATVRLIKIVALCHACHNFIHSGRLLVQYGAGRATRNYTRNILNHGMNVLKAAKIKPGASQAYAYLIFEGHTPEFAAQYIADAGISVPTSRTEWRDWKLILNGKEYRSPFQDEKEWKSYYEN